MKEYKVIIKANEYYIRASKCIIAEPDAKPGYHIDLSIIIAPNVEEAHIMLIESLVNTGYYNEY